MYSNYELMVLGDICSDTTLNLENCHDMSNGILMQGLLAVLAYYRNIIREVYAIFLTQRNDEEAVKALLATPTAFEFGNAC